MDYAIEDLIAHDHPMILVDRVLDHDQEKIETTVTIHEDTPFLEDGMVPAYVAVEYMAQSVAAYSGACGLEQGEEVRIGFLLGSRKIKLMCDGFAIGDTLHIEASSLYNDGEMASFDCVTKKDGQTVVEARLNVYQPSKETLEMEKPTDG
ncbi:hotdog family protein [Terasakiella sp. A23]|uniref:hotdog family protein n=1 Tax=Terasakiella sp. FCG-A23 TaxID=3080561 RepID=UPI002952A4C8|nr:hotdog family protein [Terasakiella sp. A23]MDV7341034.1 hotdog family protein [Terasakiella sp. A23]